jgi:cell division protein FtsB
MEQELVNTYIEKMSNRLGDFLKSEILLQTQLELAQRVVKSLTDENNELKAQLEKLNKKKKPEVDTSSF